MLIGGLILVFKKIEAVKDTLNTAKVTEALKTVSDTTSTLDTTVSTKLSPNLTSLAKNLGMGIVLSQKSRRRHFSSREQSFCSVRVWRRSVNRGNLLSIMVARS